MEKGRNSGLHRGIFRESLFTLSHSGAEIFNEMWPNALFNFSSVPEQLRRIWMRRNGA